MCTGKALHPLHQEIHEPLECDAFGRAVMRPKRLEPRLAVVDEPEAEQVFEPVLFERIALHVEEDVAGVGLGQTIEPAPAFNVQFEELDARLPGRAARELQRRLRTQLVYRFRSQTWNLCTGRQTGKRGDRARARIPESFDLRARYAGHLVQVVVVFPAPLAKLAPRAEDAVRTGLGVGIRRLTSKGEKTVARLPEIA